MERGKSLHYHQTRKPLGANGCSKLNLIQTGQLRGIELDEHSIKLTTVRTLLDMAAMNDWIAIQMDVTNAFLHGDLLETVYMKCPIHQASTP